MVNTCADAPRLAVAVQRFVMLFSRYDVAALEKAISLAVMSHFYLAAAICSGESDVKAQSSPDSSI